ncbi:unnamed protein product [Urochloa humidicola]
MCSSLGVQVTSPVLQHSHTQQVAENSHPLNVLLLSHIPPLRALVFYSVRMLQKHPVTHITILCSLQLNILLHRHVSWFANYF